jgi:acyl-CoA synthetase (AMP-forming)/AMP-acid ligase II
MVIGNHTTVRLTMASMLLRTVERHPDREAILYRGRRWTYAAWNARVNRAAHALADLGVRPHDRVALLMYPCEPAVTLYFACQKLGAVAVPMNFRLSTGEVARVLDDSGARVLTYANPLRETALRAADDARGVSELVAVEADNPPPGHHRYERWPRATAVTSRSSPARSHRRCCPRSCTPPARRAARRA